MFTQKSITKINQNKTMKLYHKIIVFLSVILNLHNIGLWIFVFNSSDIQALRVKKMTDLYFLPLTLNSINLFLFLLTIASLVIIFKYINNIKFFEKIAIPLQILFLIWQHL